MKKICIFDLDGTLADTIVSLEYSVNETLKEMNLPPITQEQCQRFVGNGAKKLLELSLRASGDKEAARLEEAMDIYRRVFDLNCTYHVTPYDGMVETLAALKEKDIRLAVLSNKPHAQTIKVVCAVFGDDCFDLICGQKDRIPRKPDPAGLYAILDESGLTKEDALYIGDSEVDIVTGKNAGVDTVSVSWGFRTKEQLMAAGAQTMLSQPQELALHLSL